jgi:hypothetical protein
MTLDFWFVPFDARKGEIIDVRSLLVDSGYIDDQIQSSKMSGILQRVQSKAGTIVQGYDEGDDFIDDSEILAKQSEVHTLDPASFRVVLASASGSSSKPSAPKGRTEESSAETSLVPESLAPFIERIKLRTYEAIDRQVERLMTRAKAVQMITLTNEMVEAIANCVDEKIRIELEKCGGNAAKRKIEIWRKDEFKLIYAQCFTARDVQFTTVRRLAMAYMKFKKESAKDQADVDDESAKEPPVEPE